MSTATPAFINTHYQQTCPRWLGDFLLSADFKSFGQQIFFQVFVKLCAPCRFKDLASRIMSKFLNCWSADSFSKYKTRNIPNKVCIVAVHNLILNKF